MEREKTNIEKWAEREVEIVRKRLIERTPGGDCGYDMGCYESALKAYNSLCDDGHSGCSFSATRNILERLCYTLPLSPITDEDFDSKLGYDIPNRVRYYGEKPMRETSIQCPRMYSLFKSIWEDGKVTYHDIDRVVCINSENKDDTFGWGFADKFIDEMFPITMPYYPPLKNRYKVYVTSFEVNKMNVYAIDKIVDPQGQNVKIPHQYFKYNELTKQRVEIKQEEYLELKSHRDNTVAQYYSTSIVNSLVDNETDANEAIFKQKYDEDWYDGGARYERIWFAMLGAFRKGIINTLNGEDMSWINKKQDEVYQKLDKQCGIFEGHSMACWSAVHSLTSIISQDQKDFVEKYPEFKPLLQTIQDCSLKIKEIIERLSHEFEKYVDDIEKTNPNERKQKIDEILQEIDPKRFRKPTQEEIEAKNARDKQNDECNCCGDCA